MINKDQKYRFELPQAEESGIEGPIQLVINTVCFGLIVFVFVCAILEITPL